MSTGRHQASSVRGRRVLILDDSESILHFSTATLTLHGFSVTGVSSLAEFERVLIDWKPDVIVVDVRMPEIDGDQVCLRLKSRPQTASTPVILLSNMSNSELGVLALRCGADAHLSKCDALDRLGAEINRVCDAV